MVDYKSYLRTCHFPLIWCPGCGAGIVMKAMVAAIDKLGLDKDGVCLVSGIGCSSRIPGYTDFNTVHTTHGRALTFATGIKMAKPDLKVVVVTGDGDCTAIGGNHLIHAARRNIDLTVVLVNNYIYGMTGGQASPTTPIGARATTAPYGSAENVFDACSLAGAAGATFVARTTTYHASMCEKYVERGIENKGFSLIEIMAACPTSFGRPNKQGDPVDMMMWQKDNAVPIAKARTMTPEDLEGKFQTGIFVETEKPECRTEYQKLIDRLQEAQAVKG
jgi:2-oxoglutarate/2-oxoacid ferredoxin oxidoreductase subunit beta